VFWKESVANCKVSKPIIIKEIIVPRSKQLLNVELQNLTLVSLKQLGNWEKQATTGKIRFELSSNSDL
jgi:hypothetical protein